MSGAPADIKPVVAATDLVRTFKIRRGLFQPPALLQAVRGVSFEIASGRTLAVVGESGSGKTTLGRMVGLIDKPTSGHLEIDGVDAAQASGGEARALRRTVQFVFQNPYGSLNPRKKIGQILEEPLIINTKAGRAERSERARAMIAKVGLRPEHYDRFPHMFSGGQRQRIAIARALMLGPKLVVADEPVSALDVSIQAQVLNLLMDLQDEFKLAYLFISHDLAVVHHIAQDVMVLYLGRPVEHGTTAQIFADPRHPYTRALLASRPSITRGGRPEDNANLVKGELPSPLNPPSGCPFHKRCPYVIERCVSEVPPLRPVRGRLTACHRAEELPEFGEATAA